MPDFIGLKGDTSDNIPGIPGIGDKTAGQLIAQYGSLEAVIEHAAELSPARARNITENADVARLSKELATMRRDLDIDCDPAQLVLDPPDRAQLKEIFRRFEFRNLLNRVDELDVAVPSAPMKVTGIEVPWREGELDFRGVVGYAVDGDRAAVAAGDEVVIGARPAKVDGDLVVHDAKPLRVDAREDTLLAAYLIDPGRAAYELDDLAAEYGVELVPDAGGGRGDDRARPPRRDSAPPGRPAARAARGARRHRPLSHDRAAAHGACSPTWRRRA